MEDSKGGSDDGSKQGLGTSDFAASDKSASSTQGQAVVSDNLKPVDGVAVVKDTPSVGAATSGTFSFGTASSSSERPTAFASFSSSWAGFGSSIASGTGLGPGFAFNKVANNGTFAPDLSEFGGCNAINMDPITTGPSFQPPACAMQFQGANTPTGEEGEKMVFGADATLFEFQDGTWKERGKGELRINVPMEGTGKARMLMRSKGNFRLILNASLFPGMKMTPMDSRGVTFACANSAVEEKSGLATYALKFKDNIVTNNFRYAVDSHENLPLDTADGTKNPSHEALKTPENSPSSVHNS
ncbi:hypothetical protein KP509_17G051100 [Ceratopteris richardii]|nr:hypothetical protein KP509_17G051100 [Ceratopteris richardii]